MRNPIISRTFLYCPRSGNRLITAEPTDEIAVVRWDNGCRTVLGGIRLSYLTASPKRYWRLEACQLATTLVRQLGGLAFDEQGTVSLIVRPRHAAEVDRMMQSVASNGGSAEDRRGNVARMIASGYYRLASSEGYGGQPRFDAVEWNHGYELPLLRWTGATRLPVLEGYADLRPSHGVDLYYEGSNVPLTVRSPWPVAECSVPWSTSGTEEVAEELLAVATANTERDVSFNDARAVGHCADGVRQWLRECLPSVAIDDLTIGHLCPHLSDERVARVVRSALVRHGLLPKCGQMQEA